MLTYHPSLQRARRAFSFGQKLPDGELAAQDDHSAADAAARKDKVCEMATIALCPVHAAQAAFAHSCQIACYHGKVAVISRYSCHGTPVIVQSPTCHINNWLI